MIFIYLLIMNKIINVHILLSYQIKDPIKDNNQFNQIKKQLNLV